MLLIYGPVLGGALLVGIGILIWRKLKMHRALTRESCLLCDSENVEVLDADMGEYRCRQCGFDSGRAREPELLPVVEDFRDLKNALDCFYEGGRLMRKAMTHATVDSNGKYYYMSEAGKQVTEGMILLQELVRRYPDLGDNPVPGSNIDARTADRDIYAGNIVFKITTALEVHGKIAESTEEVERYVAVVQDVQAAVRRRILAGLAG